MKLLKKESESFRMDNNIKENPNNIHVALAFDNNYIVHIYAMITSVFHNNRNNKIIFHTIATGISDNEKSKLNTYAKDNNAEIIFYDISQALLKANIEIPADSYFTVATFYRLFFSSLLDPAIKKLLYIDPDTIVIGDLRELYKTDIGDFPIAAIPDPYFETREELGIKEKGKYFNAGVMLIDLKNWREQKVSENVLTFVRMYPDRVPYLDQDGLNATLINRWLVLDNKFNFTSSDVKLQVPAKELIKNKVIIHFTSSRKPWNALTRNKLRYLYHYYLKMSPKSSEKNYVDFAWNIKSIWAFIRIRIKEFYFDHRIDKMFPVKKWIDSSDIYY